MTFFFIIIHIVILEIFQLVDIIPLVPKRGETSVMCKKTVTTKGANKINLFHHLKQKHPVEYEEKNSYCEF